MFRATALLTMHPPDKLRDDVQTTSGINLKKDATNGFIIFGERVFRACKGATNGRDFIIIPPFLLTNERSG